MTTQQLTPSSSTRPRIVITRTDHARLTQLADTPQCPEQVSDYLTEELARAQVVEDGESIVDVVRMGSNVTYRDSAGRERSITLVYPREANVAENRISVLTPIGAALIGMSTGQSIEWPRPDGGTDVLTVLNVTEAAEG